MFCLEFADNIAILADSLDELRDVLRNLEKVTEESRMDVNEEKTKNL